MRDEIKYNTKMDLAPNSSTGCIAGKIHDGSCILEFGCAYGRMTRYLTEGLHCCVYIVEKDPEAYQSASQYASDGICDDIESFSWVEQFKDIRFDAILFADVLEHLTQPEEVVKKAATLLKPEGSIYISIPNVTHSDVLYKGFHDHFDYTREGLLDDTHVHFWGLNNLPDFVNRCGLFLAVVEATYAPIGQTEQRMEQEGRLLLNLLRERRTGEIYQFILTLKKERGQKTEYRLMEPHLDSHVYLDTGNGFNENEIITLPSYLVKDGVYSTHYILRDTTGVRKLRFDPVEGQECILTRITVYQDGKEMNPEGASSHLDFQGGVTLMDDVDPWVIYQTDGSDHAITIDAEFIVIGEKYLSIIHEELQNYAHKLDDTQTQLNVERDELQRTAHGLQQELSNIQIARNRQAEELRLQTVRIAELEDEQESLKRRFENARQESVKQADRSHQLEAQLNRQNQTISRLENEKQQAQKEASDMRTEKDAQFSRAYSLKLLANKKDELLIEKERAINRMEEQIRQDQELLNHFRSLWTVRIRMHLAAIYHGLRRRFGLEPVPSEGEA